MDIKKIEEIIDSIQRHSNANTKYFELGMSIYDLSQKAKEIYAKAKPDEKRQLMSLVFQSLSLNEGKLISQYTKPFEVLAEAVKATNSSKVAVLEKTGQRILEPQFSAQKRTFDPKLTSLLPREDSNL